MKNCLLLLSYTAFFLSLHSCSDKDDSNLRNELETAHSDEKTISNFLSGGVESDRLQSGVATDFAPTGFYVSAQDVLKIKVEIISGSQLPVLLIGTYSRYRDQNQGNPQEVKLIAVRI